MNIFKQGFEYLILAVLMVVSSVLTILGGVFYYAYKGTAWTEGKIKHIGRNLNSKIQQGCLDRKA